MDAKKLGHALAAITLVATACSGGSASDDAGAAGATMPVPHAGTGGSASDGSAGGCAPDERWDGQRCVEAPCVGASCSHAPGDAGNGADGGGAICPAGHSGPSCTECEDGWIRGDDGTGCTMTSACGDCTPGARECQGGQQRRCIVAEDGCGVWTLFQTCGGACGNASDCQWLEGVVLEQWGTEFSDITYGMTVNPEGVPIVVGNTRGNLASELIGSRDLFVATRGLGANTASNWVVQWGVPGNNIGRDVVVDGAHNIWVVGTISGEFAGAPAGSDDLLLTRWNVAGELQAWTRWGTDQSDHPSAMKIDSSGHLIVAGWTYGDLAETNQGEEDAFVTKLDPNGTIVWSVQWGASGRDFVYDVSLDSDDNILVVGATAGFEGAVGSGPSFCRKFDAQGNHLWTRRWGTVTNGGAVGVVLLSDDALAVTGWTSTGDLGFAGSGGAYIVVLDVEDGELVWGRQFGAHPWDIGQAIATDGDGSIYIAGSTDADLVPDAHQGNEDVFVRKYNSDGDVEWTRQIGSSSAERVEDMAVKPDGTVYVVGQTLGSLPGFANLGGADNFILKIEP